MNAATQSQDNNGNNGSRQQQQQQQGNGRTDSANRPASYASVQSVEQQTLSQQRTSTMNQLNTAINNFSKARTALNWMQRDYELSFVSFNLRYQLSLLRQSRERVRNESVTEDLSGIDAANHQLEQGKLILQMEKYANERQALNIGLMYLDRNNSGGVEPENVPELSAVLYKMIDVRDKHSVTTSDLQQALSANLINLQILQNKIASINSETQHLQSQSSNQSAQLRLMQLQPQLTDYATQYNERSALLRAIYLYFHTSFLKHVFGKLNIDHTASDLEHNTIEADLKAIQQNAYHDPLEYGITEADRVNAIQLAVEAEQKLRQRNVNTFAGAELLSHALANTTFNASNVGKLRNSNQPSIDLHSVASALHTTNEPEIVNMQTQQQQQQQQSTPSYDIATQQTSPQNITAGSKITPQSVTHSRSSSINQNQNQNQNQKPSLTDKIKQSLETSNQPSNSISSGDGYDNAEKTHTYHQHSISDNSVQTPTPRYNVIDLP